MIRRTLGRGALTAGLVLLAATPLVLADGGVDKFTLTRAIPADAFLAIHNRSHDGQEFLNKQYARVWEAVRKARIDRNLKQMFKDIQKQSGTVNEEFDAQWQRTMDMWSAVDWAGLNGREFAIGMKIGFPTVEFVALLMPEADKVESSFKGLSDVAKTLVGMSQGNVELQTDGEGREVVQRISPTMQMPFPIAMTLARQGDVILVGLGSTLTEQSLALLKGDEGKSLRDTARFKAAFTKLASPTDAMVFFDNDKFMTQMRTLVKQGLEMATQQAGEDAAGQVDQIRTLTNELFASLDLWDFCATTASTDGLETKTDSIHVLRNDAKTKPFYKVVYGNGAVRDPLKFVPVTSGDFSVSSGVDLLALYDFIVDFVRKNVPDGDAQMTQFEQEVQTNTGLSIKDDLIGWIKGGIVTASVPGPNAYSPGNWVFMVELRDEEKAHTMINQLCEFMRPLLQGQNGSIDAADIVGAEDFQSINVPQLAMLGISKPTLGVKDGWLMLGSSPDMISEVLDTAEGKSDNFSKNERYRSEGLPPTSDVTALSFKDLTGMGDSLAQALGSVGLFQAFGPPQLTSNPAAKALLGIVPKFARVAHKLDFLQSSSSRTTREGDTVRTQAVVTYREPPKVGKPAAGGSE